MGDGRGARTSGGGGHAQRNSGGCAVPFLTKRGCPVAFLVVDSGAESGQRVNQSVMGVLHGLQGVGASAWWPPEARKVTSTLWCLSEGERRPHKGR